MASCFLPPSRGRLLTDDDIYWAGKLLLPSWTSRKTFSRIYLTARVQRLRFSWCCCSTGRPRPLPLGRRSDSRNSGQSCGALLHCESAFVSKALSRPPTADSSQRSASATHKSRPRPPHAAQSGWKGIRSASCLSL